MKNCKLKRGDFVYIEWNDHSADTMPWVYFADISARVLTCVSNGIFVAESEKVIIITHTIADKNQASSPQTILKTDITKIQKTKKAKGQL